MTNGDQETCFYGWFKGLHFRRIKEKWRQSRSYSGDLAETLRQQDEQSEARERSRAERNRKRKAEGPLARFNARHLAVINPIRAESFPSTK
jgi:hypothetical protein